MAQEEPPTSTTAVQQSTSTSVSTTTTTTLTATTTTEPLIEWDFAPSESAPVVTLVDTGSAPREIRAYAMKEAVRVAYDYTGTEVHDTTTWTAYITGNPIRLVE